MSARRAQPLRPPLAHEATVALLRRELALRWKPGDRLPPLKQWSRELGVGQISLQRAARSLVREGCLMSRTRHGTFVRQLPELSEQERLEADAATRGVGVGDDKARRVTIAIAPSRDAFLEPAVRELHRTLSAHGLMVQNQVHRMNQGDPGDWIGDEQGVVLVQPQPGHAVHFPRHCAVVVICTSILEPLTSPVEHDVVSVDSERGGALAGWHLRKASVESAAFIGVLQDGEPEITSAARLRGFSAAFGRVASEHCIWTRYYSSEWGARGFARWLELPDRPDGVFCASDDLALGFIYASLSRGMEPGRDYQIVGFDAQNRLREITTGSLASVSLPIEEMGRTAGELLVSRLAQPHQASRRLLLGCSMLTQGDPSRYSVPLEH